MKNKKVLLFITIFLCLIIVFVTYIKLTYNKNSDSVKFKKEYESYNNKYIKLNINSNNRIKYSDYEEIFNIIEKGTGIIYLGEPDSNLCRNIVPVLFDVAKENNIKKIYYLNIKNDMDYYIVDDDTLVYDINDDGEEQKGTEDYFKLLEILDKYLLDYIIELDGKTYNTDEKRIYTPTVIFVKDGRVVGLHMSTVSSHSNPDKKLSSKQYKELYEIYEDYILDMTSETCGSDSSGSGC